MVSRLRQGYGAVNRPPLQRSTSIAERDIDVARGLHHFAVRGDVSQAIHRIGDRNVSNLIILIADHRTEVPFIRQLNRFDTKTRAQSSVQRSWRAAALQMSEHTRSRFFSSSFGNFARNHIPDPTEPKFAAVDVAFDLLTIFWTRAFSDDDERAEPARSVAFFYRVRNFSVIERDLGNQNNIGPAGNSAMKRNPTGVAPHHFNNHHALVTRCRGMQTIERIHHFRLSRAAAEEIFRTLATEPIARRRHNPGLEPGRVDVIVGGVIVVVAVMRHWGFDELLVSEADILDGLAMTLRPGRAKHPAP